MRTYNNRSNCIRAAKSVYGKSAKAGTDFLIENARSETGGDAFYFTNVDGTDAKVAEKKARAPKAAKAKKAKAKKAPKEKKAKRDKPAVITDQPKMQTLLAAISSEAKSPRQLAIELKVEPHTVRGAISRLRAAGCAINMGRMFREVFYSYHPRGGSGDYDKHIDSVLKAKIAERESAAAE